MDNFFTNENVSRSSWVKFTNVGDYVYGTLVAKKTVKSNFSQSGEAQAYEILAKEGLSGGQKIQEGSRVNVGGKASIDAGLSSAKIGQIVGIKYTEKVASKTKGYQEAKLIKVFTKGEMNDEWLKNESETVEGGF
jgi:hypothetical protein